MRQIILALLLLFSAPTVWATSYYVRTDGHNTNCNGTVNASAASAPNCAWLTITKAAGTMVGGDTTLVQDGTYTEAEITFATANVTVQAQTQWGAILDSTSRGTCAPAISLRASNVTIRDLHVRTAASAPTCGNPNASMAQIRGWNVQEPVLGGNESTGHTGGRVTGVKFSNTSADYCCSVKLNQDNGIIENIVADSPIETFNGNDQIMRNNTITLRTTDLFGAISKGGARNSLIYGNTITLTGGNVVGIYTGGASCPACHFDTVEQIECYNCVAFNNTVIDTGGGVHTVAYAMVSCKNCSIFNNIGYNGQFGAMAPNNGVLNANPTWQNNIGYSNTNDLATEPGYNGWTNYAAGTITISYNTFYGYSGGVPSQSAGALTTDPQFVSVGSDWHLQAGSPSINSGITVTAPRYGGGSLSVAFDKSSTARPIGPTWERGVYEYPPMTRYLDTVACSGNYSVAARDCSGSGSGLSSYTTYASIFAVTLPGDTIDIRAGSWGLIDGNVLAIPSGTSWDNAVTIKAHTGETASMPGINFAGLGEAGLFYYIIVDGLVSDGGNVGIGINQGNHHIRIQNCEIKNTYYNGMEIFWGNNNFLPAEYIEVLNCHIHHIGKGGGPGFPEQPAGFGRAHGIYITTSHNLLKGNTFDHIGEYALHQWVSGHQAISNVFDGNIMTSTGQNTTRYGITCCGGITACCGSGTVIKNNIIWGDGTLPINGIEVHNSCLNCKVFNNTTYNMYGYGVYAYGTTTAVRNNLGYLNRFPDYLGAATPTDTRVIQSNNMGGVNPSFVDAGVQNFRLQSGSAARDQGMLLTTDVLTDFYGVTRPKGATHDIGAAEYDSGADTTAPGSPANFAVQ